jgi:hypothetical protein
MVRAKSPSPGTDVNIGPVRALLVDATHVASTAHLGISAHAPFLRVRTSLVQNAHDFMDYMDGSFLKVPLSGQIVGFTLDHASTAKTDVYAALRPDQAGLDHCPTGDDWREITWLPNMDLVIPANGKPVKSDYLTKADLSNTPVAARVEIGGGRLICEPPSMTGFDKEKAQFTGTSKYHHIITDVVKHVSPAATNIGVTFTKFGGAPDLDEMRLNLTYGDVEVYIDNMKVVPNAPDTDHHFAAYYSLLDGYALDRFAPAAGHRCDNSSAEGNPDWPLYCPPPLMS